MWTFRKAIFALVFLEVSTVSARKLSSMPMSDASEKDSFEIKEKQSIGCCIWDVKVGFKPEPFAETFTLHFDIVFPNASTSKDEEKEYRVIVELHRRNDRGAPLEGAITREQEEQKSGFTIKLVERMASKYTPLTPYIWSSTRYINIHENMDLKDIGFDSSNYWLKESNGLFRRLAKAATDVGRNAKTTKMAKMPGFSSTLEARKQLLARQLKYSWKNLTV